MTNPRSRMAVILSFADISKPLPTEEQHEFEDEAKFFNLCTRDHNTFPMLRLIYKYLSIHLKLIYSIIIHTQIKKVEHLFIHFVSLCFSSFKSCLFKSFCHVSTKWVPFSPVDFKGESGYYCCPAPGLLVCWACTEWSTFDELSSSSSDRVLVTISKLEVKGT